MTSRKTATTKLNYAGYGGIPISEKRSQEEIINTSLTAAPLPQKSSKVCQSTTLPISSLLKKSLGDKASFVRQSNASNASGTTKQH